MQDVALDACCLINLCAAGRILRPSAAAPADARQATKAARPENHPGIGLKLHIPSRVTAEILYIMQPDEEDRTKFVKRPLDVQEYIAAGLLSPCDFQDRAEAELFVRMAAQLGDGEAACFAISKQRGWALATDDRRARRLAADSGLGVITTPELVKRWAENTKARDKDVAVALQNIQRFAYFTPRANAPEYTWWTGCLRKAGT